MIIYIHGFGGSGEGNKAKQFRKYFHSIGEDFIAPSLSYVPKLAIKTLEELIKYCQGDIYLIGSSLGGFYATFLANDAKVKKVVLINPAVNPHITLQKSTGDAPNFYDQSYYGWNDKHIQILKQYRSLSPSIVQAQKEKFMLLLQKRDELLDYKEAVDFYDGAHQVIEDSGSHSFEGIKRHFEMIQGYFNEAHK